MCNSINDFIFINSSVDKITFSIRLMTTKFLPKRIYINNNIAVDENYCVIGSNILLDPIILDLLKSDLNEDIFIAKSMLKNQYFNNIEIDDIEIRDVVILESISNSVILLSRDSDFIFGKGFDYQCFEIKTNDKKIKISNFGKVNKAICQIDKYTNLIYTYNHKDDIWMLRPW